jgi:predicted metalloprotease with PDZ domain
MSETAGGVVEIVEVFPAIHVLKGAPLLEISNTSPGLTRPQAMTDLAVTDSRGSVPLSADREKYPDAWRAGRAVEGDLTIRYRLPIMNDNRASGGPQGSPRIDGDGISSIGEMLLMKPETSKPYRLSVAWRLSAMGPGAEGVWTYGEGEVTLPAGPLSRLQESFYMAGHIKREPEKPSRAFNAVWTGDPGFDPRPGLRWACQLYGWMSRFFGDRREPLYHVFLRYNPAANAGGGTAVPHSFLWTYGAGVSPDHLKAILGHEMTHTWTATSIGQGIGKWYDEGDAVYYQVRLPWRAGLVSSSDYLKDINLTAARYYTNELAHLRHASVMSGYWNDVRKIVIPYDRGAIYFAVLDGKIRKASGGKRSVDDLIRVIVERNRRELPTDAAYWMRLVRGELGEPGVQLTKAMLNGATLVPDSNAYGPCFRRVAAKIRRYQLGYDYFSATRQGVVAGLVAGSAAAKAGIRNGDRIVLRTNTDGAQRDPNMTLTVKLTRGARTFTVMYLPRGEEVDAWQWRRVPGVPDSTCRRS